MGHNLQTNITTVVAKYARAEGKHKRKKDVAAATSLLALSTPVTDTNCGEAQESDVEETSTTGVIETACQTDVSGQDLQRMSDCVNTMTYQIVTLQENVNDNKMDEPKFKNNDKNVKLYTDDAKLGHCFGRDAFTEELVKTFRCELALMKFMSFVRHISTVDFIEGADQYDGLPVSVTCSIKR
ncbi:hypothetical protein ElyMa_004573000 [Elysia marginata]|uniref:Uncharacterized protein n=1 Tax=Elysia marginata TaxID=1093978 RepID=A0AAV4HX46_9GAST|nr:hypothetical protein ElyMa_004573000 [Elysia marginata]